MGKNRQRQRRNTEILRFAQNDLGFAQNDLVFAQNDLGFAQNDDLGFAQSL